MEYAKATGALCIRWLLIRGVILNQTAPCAIMASATFRKPAMFAPAT